MNLAQSQDNSFAPQDVRTHVRRRIRPEANYLDKKYLGGESLSNRYARCIQFVEYGVADQHRTGIFPDRYADHAECLKPLI